MSGLGELTERALELARAGPVGPDAAAQLVKLADGKREPLEEARDELVGLLQTSSSDFHASVALRLVAAALSETGFTYERFGAGPTGRRLMPKALWSH